MSKITLSLNGREFLIDPDEPGFLPGVYRLAGSDGEGLSRSIHIEVETREQWDFITDAVREGVQADLDTGHGVWYDFWVQSFERVPGR